MNSLVIFTVGVILGLYLLVATHIYYLSGRLFFSLFWGFIPLYVKIFRKYIYINRSRIGMMKIDKNIYIVIVKHSFFSKWEPLIDDMGIVYFKEKEECVSYLKENFINKYPSLNLEIEEK